MKTTNKFDRNGQEIFENDKVLNACGILNWDNSSRVIYQLHTIVKKEERFHLGRLYNLWEGKQVMKVDFKDAEELNIMEDTAFFFDDNGGGGRKNHRPTHDGVHRQTVGRRNKTKRRYYI